MVLPNAGIFTAMLPKPASWQIEAPYCLPRPMAIIFMMPLSYGPLKHVCGFMRLTTMMPSDSAAYLSIYTSTPNSLVPILTVSIVALTGHPMVSSLMPSPLSISL